MADLLIFSEIALNLAVVIVAVCGLYVLWMGVAAATRQTEATRKLAAARHDHAAKLFDRAVGQLSDVNPVVRFGAVLTLRQIARNRPGLAETTVNLLSTYLREGAADLKGTEPPNETDRRSAPSRGRLSGFDEVGIR